MSALVNRTHKCQNFTDMIERRPRNTKQQLNASITVCKCVSVCCTDKQTIHAPGRHSFIALVFKSVCGSHHFAAEEKKKLLINFKTRFLRIVVGKKLLIKTEKVNYSLVCQLQRYSSVLIVMVTDRGIEKRQFSLYKCPACYCRFTHWRRQEYTVV